MKTTTRNAIVVVSAAALVGLTATAQAISAPPASTTTATSVAAADLESGLAEDLQFSREEERMARDLYAALAEVHDGARPMSRITNSEQQHFDRVGALLEQYGIDDPSEGLATGKYAFPALQELYDDWFADGKESVNAAYQVGIELETRDIADLKSMIADTSQADAVAVFSRLLAASEKHLAAFTSAADGTMPTELGQGLQNQNRPGPQNQNGPGMSNRGLRQGDQGQAQGQPFREDGVRPFGPRDPQGPNDCYLTDTDDTDDTGS
ncbi:MAG: DUF2202 domain-containing protein [Dermatophilaceae bacterium]|nr:DUF2202 domain-containing protein [Intrasporangiaceae bacterium]